MAVRVERWEKLNQACFRRLRLFHRAARDLHPQNTRKYLMIEKQPFFNHLLTINPSSMCKT
jgi:hypothetical protein